MQAARGASLISSDPGTQDRKRTTRSRIAFAIIAVACFLVDLGSKQWALHALRDEDIAVFGDWFVLHLTFNPGAAFSVGTEFTVVFTVLAIVAALVILWISRRLGSTMWAIALGVLLGGVAGNLTDRIFREPEALHGHVVDFLMLPNWPVFNIADVCINLGAGLIILQTLRGIAVDGTRDSEP